MQFINVRGAKANLSKYLNNLKESGPVVITSNGKPKAVIQSLSEDELDSFVIRNSQEIYNEAVAGAKEIAEGKTYSVDEAFDKIDEIRANDKKHKTNRKHHPAVSKSTQNCHQKENQRV